MAANSFWGNSLFSPKIITRMVQGTGTTTNITLASLSGSSIESTSSFDFDSVGQALRSTQQIPLEWGKFENHTFFDSAESKINVAFDTIINYYPFDGSKDDIDDFLDKLTGFEKYVFNRFPSWKGYLRFSGSTGDGSRRSAEGGSRIVVQDRAGALFPSISRDNSANAVLDPGLKTISFEFFLHLPEQANENEVILQKLSGSAMGMTIALSQSDSVTACDLIFLASSGSSALITTASVTKGRFQHVAAVFDRKASILADLKLYVSGELKDQSTTTFDMNYIDFSGSPLRIGSGSTHSVGAISGSTAITDSLWLPFVPSASFSGALDELRIFHGSRGLERINLEMYKPLFADPSTLKLYYKFNEPTGSYTNDDVVLDSSGNSLHGKIHNFKPKLRFKGDLLDPIPLENVKLSPVLFPSYPDLVNLNADLMVSGTYYDANNPNLITKLIPQHYLELSAQDAGFDSSRASLGELYEYNIDIPGGGRMTSVQIISSLLFTWARLFDQIKIFIDQFGKLLTVDYDAQDTISNQLLSFFGNYYGFSLPNNFSNASPSQYISGENLNNEAGISEFSLKEIQAEIWRRILVNMQEIVRSKGTIHSIKAIMRASGINPDNLFRFREFGGSRFITTKDSRTSRTEVSSLIRVSGSANIQSPFMSGSRIEVGYPFLSSKSRAIGQLTVADSGSISTGDYFTLTDVKGTELGFQFGGTVPNNRVNLDEMGDLGSDESLVAQFISNALTASSPDRTKLYELTGSSVAGRIDLTQSVYFSAGGNTTIDVTNMTAGAFTPVVDFAGGTGFDYAKNQYPPHGISGNTTDGLFTSGSWTFEGLYNFNNLGNDSPDIMTQSLVRMFTTGSTVVARNGALLMNIVAYGTGSGLYETGSVVMFARPNTSLVAPTLKMELTGVDVFDKNDWHISFGRVTGNATSSFATSSYFLRAGRQSYGKLIEYHYSSSFFMEDGAGGASSFSNLDSGLNASGSYFLIGSGTIETVTTRFLNDTDDVEESARFTNFNGNVGRLRFWSEGLIREEDEEHVRNFKSVGVTDPTLNFNFVTKATGSFERLRVNVHCDQQVTKSDGFGLIDLFDYSQNNLHWSGSSFITSSQILDPHQIDYSILDAKFDERSAENKVRIWSFDQEVNMREFNALKTPVTSIPLSYPVTDDTRFSIEVSCVQALNDDIMNILSTLDFFDSAIGNPELMFADSYPKLANLREVYFNRLTGQVNYKNLFEFYKWFDDSLSIIIERLIPRTTKFLGINFVIESHVLERAKMRYLQSDIYLGENDRRGLGGDIFLQQIVGSLRRY